MPSTEELAEIRKSYWPNVPATFLVFHIMIIVGGIMLVIVIVGGIFWIRGTLFASDLPLTEGLPLGAGLQRARTADRESSRLVRGGMGRQPWIVYELLKTGDALSKVVTANHIMASLIMFAFVYLLLFAVFIFLLTRKIQHGPRHGEESEEMPESWKDVVRHAPEARV